MEQIQISARFRVKPGRLDAFKSTARELVAAVEAREPRALQYLWYASPDESEWIVREIYEDSAAVLEHVANAGPLIGKILDTADLKLEIFGPVSAELKAALVPFQAATLGYFHGVSRI